MNKLRKGVVSNLGVTLVIYMMVSLNPNLCRYNDLSLLLYTYEAMVADISMI